MSALADIFDHRIDFDPDADFEAFLKSVPGKWVVYLMAGANDEPVQLLCVKNLRYSLERRLGTGEATPAPAASGGDGTDDSLQSQAAALGLSRKVNYREIVRRVYWTRVDSSFEADAAFLEVARHVFPQSYRGMFGFRPAWFVHVNPWTTFPRYTKTIEPIKQTGVHLGPIEDKHAAQKLVHLAENLFDLCRDYSILTQSPNGGPCPWRQMNKCVGPCDGSIDLDAYRQLIAYSAAVLADPADAVREHTRRMNAAAAELRFETAEKIKAYVEQLGQLGKGPFRHVRPLEKFQYVTLQRGPRAGTAKVFVITPGRIEQIACLINEPRQVGDLLRQILAAAHERREDGRRLDDNGVERIGVVAHHLFQPKARQGIFLPIETIDEKSVSKAYRDLLNQKPQDDATGEGVTKELQAL
ncbi:MAG: excinuclease subunit [Humisphaera sp.]|nr:excinuclease subunit [Humisphaera sp.]